MIFLDCVCSNKASDQLVSLDFNVLDSLSAKLDRPVCHVYTCVVTTPTLTSHTSQMGVSPHNGVPVPFVLLPGKWHQVPRPI